MTRDEKRTAIINKINKDIEHELKIADKMKFDGDKEKTEFKFAIYALHTWVNSDKFLDEPYPNLVIHKNKGAIYFVGCYCNDQTVKSHIIDIFDYIFYKNKDRSKDGEEV